MVRVDITEGGKADSPVIGRKGTAEVHWRSSRHGDEDTEVYLRSHADGQYLSFGVRCFASDSFPLGDD